jgi:Arc/MetJ family transcription regulator
MGLTFLAVAAMFAQPPAADAQPQIITNYWRYVSNILDREEAKANVPPPTARSLRYPPTREFPFDALRDLTAKDLVRAAKEGLQQARQSNQGQPPDVVARAAEANMQRALEYFPVLAENDQALDLLLGPIAAEKDDPLLRIFLIRRCAPGLAPPSLFSLYFQDTVARNQGQVKDLLTQTVGRMTELAEVKLPAMDALYAYLEIGYQRVFEKDVALKEFAQAQGMPITPALLNAPGAPAASPETQASLTACERQSQEFIVLMRKQLEDDKTQSPDLQRRAREFLERISREFPLSNQETVKALLEKYGPNSAAGGQG